VTGHLCGARLLDVPREAAPPTRRQTALRTPDGRAYLITERDD